jgi:hypothetical protein
MQDTFLICQPTNKINYLFVIQQLITFIYHQWFRGRSAANNAVETEFESSVCVHPILGHSVIVILWQKSVNGKRYYIGNVRYHWKNPIVLMILPNNPAGNKFR